jgi:glycosyltransferase involved in cell wall biosynthesis
MPVNTDFVEQIQAARSDTQSRDGSPYILYFGQFKSHKNLERLINGFCASTFASKGGRLVMVGGKDKAVQRLRLQIPDTMASQITVDGQQDSAKLVELVAGARAVAFVSLEEGFGLPPLEAALAGVPTLTVDLPWAHEAMPVDVPRCDPTSTESIAVGIDKVVDQSAAHTCDLQQALDQHRQGVTAQAMAEAIMLSIVL